MALFWEGLAAFLEAVGIAAILWVLFDWFMYPKKAGNVPEFFQKMTVFPVDRL